MKWDQKLQNYLTKLKRDTQHNDQSLGNVKTPQSRKKIKSVTKSNNEAKNEKIILPNICKNNQLKHELDQSNLKQNRSQIVKSAFAQSMHNKMKKVLEGIKCQVPNDNDESYDSDDFDFQFKIKKNKQMLRKQKGQKTDKNEQLWGKSQMKEKILQLLKVVKQIPLQRPKSSRDATNDNEMIADRNKKMLFKRPKSSKIIKKNIVKCQPKQQIPQTNKRTQQKSMSVKIRRKDLSNHKVSQQREKNSVEKILQKYKFPKHNQQKKEGINLVQEQDKKQIVTNKRILSEQKKPKNKIPTPKILAKIKGTGETNNLQLRNIPKPPSKRGNGVGLKNEQNNNQWLGQNRRINSYKNLLQDKKMTTQDLRNAKKQLEQKIKKIDEQLGSSQLQQLQQINRQKQMKILVVPDKMVLNSQYLLGSDTRVLNVQFDKLKNLQEKNQQLISDYIEQKMALIQMEKCKK